MTPARVPHCRLLEDTGGVVFLEFLMAVMPLWTFAACTFQLALIAHASLIVRHSADAAARSAAVVLPDDPGEYGGEPQMSVARNRVDPAGFIDSLARRIPGSTDRSGVESIQATGRGPVAHLGRSRLNTIRLAAHVPLMPLAGSLPFGMRYASFERALARPDSLASAPLYQPFAVAVTFPGIDGDLVTGPEVTVRVTYAFQCRVPLARAILCRAFDDLAGQQSTREVPLGAPEGLVRGRFREIHHEATTLVHEAPYEYRPRGS